MSNTYLWAIFLYHINDCMLLWLLLTIAVYERQILLQKKYQAYLEEIRTHWAPYLKVASNTEDKSDLGFRIDLLMSSDTDYTFLFPSGGTPTGATLYRLVHTKKYLLNNCKGLMIYLFLMTPVQAVRAEFRVSSGCFVTGFQMLCSLVQALESKPQVHYYLSLP